MLLGELQRRYGVLGSVRMMVPILRQRRRLGRAHPATVAELRRDWGSGAVNEALTMTALFDVLVPIEGREGAYGVVRRIFETIAPMSMRALYQSEDRAGCDGDPFENFKRFHLTLFDHSQQL